MSEYPAFFDVASLDGLNGFRVDGESAGDYSGRIVSLAGDVNGDGFEDIIIGTWGAAAHKGAAYVVFGHGGAFDATFDLSSLDGGNGFQLTGETTDDRFGRSVSVAGDINGDGYDDVVVGAQGADHTGGKSGSTYVVFGQAGGIPGDIAVTSLDGNNGFRIDGEGPHDRTGWAVSDAGDINGDGIDDVMLGGYAVEPNKAGGTYIIFGHTGGFDPAIDLKTLDGVNGFKIGGEAEMDKSGWAVSSAGDVNGDGVDDLMIGAWNADRIVPDKGLDSPDNPTLGAAYVVFGHDGPFDPAMTLADLDGDNGFKLDGEAENDKCGRAVSSAGDFNADGFADIIVGAIDNDAAGTDPKDDTGAAYLLYGGPGGFPDHKSLSDLDGTDGFKIQGENAGDLFGRSVSVAGDVNNDGFSDVIMGAWRADPDGPKSGAAYVLFGSDHGFGASFDLAALDGDNGFKIAGAAAEDFLGERVSAAGDVNGDGLADLVVGAWGADPNGNQSGSTYVIFGVLPDAAVDRTGTDIKNTIQGGNFDDTVTGLGGDDTLYGHDGADTLDGTGGNDVLAAGSSADFLYGGGGKDVLKGGTGADTLIGGEGVDHLDGGLGNNVFVYGAAVDSTGKDFDAIANADFTHDAFDVTSPIAGINATISSGQLRGAHFDDDLAVAANGHLGAGHAVLFTPDSGRLAGKTFLVIDLNGNAGYQGGADLVVELSSAHNLGALGAEDFI